MKFFLVCLYAFAISVPLIRGADTNELKSQNVSLGQSINSEECGPVKMASRIIGGKVVPLGQFPWMARLGYLSSEDNTVTDFRCGGSLISEKYVLTAAHCIHGWKEQLHVVRLGEHFANTTEDCVENICAPPVQDISIHKCLMHPRYDHKTVKHDIGLIRLSKEAQYNDFVKPICLPYDEMLNKNYMSQWVEIAGWGVINSDSQKESNTLLYVSLPIRDLCACAEVMPDFRIDNTQFCVGLETGEDSCTGDSGGPMMKMERMLGKKKYFALGVVSVGKNYCGEAPAVYTNVGKYSDWILETIASTEKQNASTSN